MHVLGHSASENTKLLEITTVPSLLKHVQTLLADPGMSEHLLNCHALESVLPQKAFDEML